MSKPLKLAGNDVEIKYTIITKNVYKNKFNPELGKMESKKTTVHIPKITNVTINTKHGEILVGKATCSENDVVRKETGRKTAMKRALAQSTLLTKTDRTEFWKEYNNLKPTGRW